MLVRGPLLGGAGPRQDVDQAAGDVDDAGQSEDPVPLLHLTGHRHAGHDEGGEEPGDLGHGVGDAKQHS